MSGSQIRLTIEHFAHKFDGLVEASQVMTSFIAKAGALQEAKENVKTIKKVVTTTNKVLRKIEYRILRLEMAI